MNEVRYWKEYDKSFAIEDILYKILSFPVMKIEFKTNLMYAMCVPEIHTKDVSKCNTDSVKF